MALANSNGYHRTRPPYIMTLGFLIAGMALGALAGTLWLWLTPPSVPLEEYTVLVSAAYDRERLPLNAIERLTATGVRDAAGTLSVIAKEFRRNHPDRSRDAGSLEQLADVLKAQTAPNVSQRAANSDSLLGWLVLPLILVIAAMSFVAVRRRARKPRSALRSLPEAEVPQLPKAQLVGGMRSTLPLGERDNGSIIASQSEAPAAGSSATQPKTGRLSAVAGKRREVILRPFACTYHAGDEPFEDVHPIMYDEGNTLIGACGLTAAAKIEASSPARYYAFTAWVHDYLSGEPMSALGLLSHWASGRKRLTLYDPALTRATLHRTEKGLTSRMETRNLIVTVEVADMSYGTARDVPANSYFTVLSVKFTVTIKP